MRLTIRSKLILLLSAFGFVPAVAMIAVFLVNVGEFDRALREPIRGTAASLQVHQAEDRHEAADVERGTARVEAVVGADDLPGRKARLEAGSRGGEHPSPAEFVEEARKARGRGRR